MNDYFSSAISCLVLVHLVLGDTYLPSVLVAQTVKNLPTVQKTEVWFLGREDFSMFFSSFTEVQLTSKNEHV